MPTISMFYGIIVRMYCDRAEHNPPHFHAYYQDFSAAIDIEECRVLQGELPPRQTRLVLAWAELRREELMADWKLAMGGEPPMAIDPLR